MIEEDKKGKKKITPEFAIKEKRKKSQKKEDGQGPKKRAKKSKSSEDYDAYIDSFMAQLRSMPMVPLQEPTVNINHHICPVVGYFSGKFSRFKTKFSPHCLVNSLHNIFEKFLGFSHTLLSDSTYYIYKEMNCF